MSGTYWQHKKTGGVYRVICEATEEATEKAVVVYRNTENQKVWTRPKEQFLDGRFREIGERYR